MLSHRNLQLFVLSFFLFLGQSVANNTKVTVSIYYESLCPGSIDFIKDKVYPNLNCLKDHLDMDWVPYGHAKHNITDGKLKFKCQHGERECKGNIFQACALDQGQPVDKVAGIIYCLMSSEDPASLSSLETCSSEYHFDNSALNDCVSSDKGPALLAKLGDRTHNLTKLKYVPTTIYNGVYDSDLNDKSLEGFLETACTQISKPKPSCCNDELE